MRIRWPNPLALMFAVVAAVVALQQRAALRMDIGRIACLGPGYPTRPETSEPNPLIPVAARPPVGLAQFNFAAIGWVAEGSGWQPVGCPTTKSHHSQHF